MTHICKNLFLITTYISKINHSHPIIKNEKKQKVRGNTVPSRCVADVSRDALIKLIIVEEDGRNNVHIKEPRVDRTAIVIESEVQKREIDGAEDFIRERPLKFIVAKIELVQELDHGNEFGYGAKEKVGIGMEVCDVRQLVGQPIESELRATKVEIIEAKPRHRPLVFSIRIFVAPKSFVAANIGPIPCSHDLQWVILDSTFVVLNHSIGNFDSLALES